MRKKVRSRLAAVVLVLAVAALGTVIGGDVIVKEGIIIGEVFVSTTCGGMGTNIVAFGDHTAADGDYSTAMGYYSVAEGDYSTAMGNITTASGECSTAIGADTTASGSCSIAMGVGTQAAGGTSMAMGYITQANGNYSMSTGAATTASGIVSTAMGNYTNATQFCSLAAGYYTDASAYYATAFGKYSTNNVANSFTVGYGTSPTNRKIDFKVESGVVTIGNVATLSGDLYVGNKVDAHVYASHSSFYDKDTYGEALDYAADCSKTIQLNAQGQKEYNHEADPQFLKTYITVKDYDKYTDTKVWNEQLKEYEPERIYETHQEVRTDLGMQVAWLRQCVYELKQENEQLKAELDAIKAKLGME